MNLRYKLFAEKLGDSDFKAGVARILFFSILYFTAGNSYLTEFTKLNAQLHCTDYMGTWALFDLSYNSALLLLWIFKISILTSMIGLFTQISYWFCFLSFFILNLYALQFCYSNHSLMPLNISLFLWALLDRSSSLRLENKFFVQKEARLETSSYLFRAMKIHFCIIFFASGLSKLRYGGLSWIFSDSMENKLLLQNYYYANNYAHQTFSFLNYWVISHPLFCKFLAFGTVLIELAAPFAFYKKNLARLIIPQILIMQIGIFVLMYLNFSPWLSIYVFWLWPQKDIQVLNWIKKKLL